MFCQCVCEPTSVNRHHHKMWFFCTSVREPTSVLPFLPLEYECQWLPTTCSVIIIKLIFFKIMIMITSSSDLLIIEPEVKASIVPLSWQPRILHPNPPWSQSGWSRRKLAGWWMKTWDDKGEHSRCESCENPTGPIQLPAPILLSWPGQRQSELRTSSVVGWYPHLCSSRAVE